MTASEVFNQQDGEVTKSYYAELSKRGPLGEIAVALFRAQKRSSRAKDYRRGKWRRAAYDVKQWSLSEVCRLLAEHGARFGFRYGWKEDASVVFGERASYVLYVDIPQVGQCSFHSPDRGGGPDYAGEWDREHASADRIIVFCDSVVQRDTVEAECNSTREPVAVVMSPMSAPKPLVFGDPDSIARKRQRRRA